MIYISKQSEQSSDHLYIADIRSSQNFPGGPNQKPLSPENQHCSSSPIPGLLNPVWICLLPFPFPASKTGRVWSSIFLVLRILRHWTTLFLPPPNRWTFCDPSLGCHRNIVSLMLWPHVPFCVELIKPNDLTTCHERTDCRSVICDMNYGKKCITLIDFISVASFILLEPSDRRPPVQS